MASFDHLVHPLDIRLVDQRSHLPSRIGSRPYLDLRQPFASRLRTPSAIRLRRAPSHRSSAGRPDSPSRPRAPEEWFRSAQLCSSRCVLSSESLSIQSQSSERVRSKRKQIRSALTDVDAPCKEIASLARSTPSDDGVVYEKPPANTMVQ